MSSMLCQVINFLPDTVVQGRYYSNTFTLLSLICVGFNVYNVGIDQIGELCISYRNSGAGQCELHMCWKCSCYKWVLVFSQGRIRSWLVSLSLLAILRGYFNCLSMKLMPLVWITILLQKLERLNPLHC